MKSKKKSKSSAKKTTKKKTKTKKTKTPKALAKTAKKVTKKTKTMKSTKKVSKKLSGASKKAKPKKALKSTVASSPKEAPAIKSNIDTVESPPIVRTSTMSKKKLEEFRKLLLNKKNDLIKEAVLSFGDLTEVQEVMPDMTDQASAEMDRNFMLRIKDRERKLILKINEVLERIDEGTYGVCEICGDMIGEQRLHVRPETTQCIECKTDMEERERREAMFMNR